MNERQLNQYGVAVLRISLGVMLIAHSVYLKLMVFTLPGTAEFFGSLGLPPTLAYIVFAAEAVGGIALVLGIQSRWAALALVPVLAGANLISGFGGLASSGVDEMVPEAAVLHPVAIIQARGRQRAVRQPKSGQIRWRA